MTQQLKMTRLFRMKTLAASTGAIGAVVAICSLVSGAFAASSIDSRVEELLKKMTLEEKVGQMTQLTLETVAEKGSLNDEQNLDPEKLENAIVKHNVGSILNVVDHTFSVDHWQDVITQIQDVATKKTRLRIPVLYGIDAIHGATYTKGATLFPQAIAMAATWNRELIRKEGTVTAQEVKASGIPWNFYPVLDVARQPLWPRVYETYGEDTYLATVLGTEYIEAHQAAGVANCLKHYIGYSYPWSGKDRTPAIMTERMLRETFLPPFEAGVRAGVPTVMVNSGEIDGVPGHANPRLLIDILRGELGFKGFTVSDWADIERLYSRDRIASSPKEAVRIAVMAGVDMSMVPMNYAFYDLLIQLVNDGDVPMARIDEAVGRILKVKMEMGLMDNPYPDSSLKKNIATAESTAANLESAREALTLLKNDGGFLPLSKKAKVLVTGPNADLLSVLNGGWTITWQGDQEQLYPKDKKTILRAIREKIGADNVVYAANADDAVKAAKDVDAAIVCIGEKTYTETPGNIDDLTLDADQLALASQLERTGTPVILVLVEGRTRVIRPIVDGAKAILMAYLPGMEGAPAIADVLFGDVNPSGKLPLTYPRAPNDLTLYDHTRMEETDGNVFKPEFQFGSGLSYTTFAYSGLKLDRDRLKVGEDLHIKVNVSNTGKREGKETVQLYMTDLYASVARPVKQLRGFEKVLLQPGETKTVEFTLRSEDMSFIDVNNKRIIESGQFRVMVGPLTQNFVLTKK